MNDDWRDNNGANRPIPVHVDKKYSVIVSIAGLKNLMMLIDLILSTSTNLDDAILDDLEGQYRWLESLMESE